MVRRPAAESGLPCHHRTAAIRQVNIARDLKAIMSKKLARREYYDRRDG